MILLVIILLVLFENLFWTKTINKAIWLRYFHYTISKVNLDLYYCQYVQQQQTIKFTSCLPMVGGSLWIYRLLSPLKLVAMILLKVALKHQNQLKFKSKNSTLITFKKKKYSHILFNKNSQVLQPPHSSFLACSLFTMKKPLTTILHCL